MTGRRDQVLRAAVEVLGEGGARALTHRAVDERAGVPAGTASNSFRTRDALLRAVLAAITEAETARYAALPTVASGAAPAVEQTAQEIAALVRHLAGPARVLALARHAVFLEAARRPELQAELTAASAVWWSRVADRLAALGSPEPAAHARVLLAHVDGLLVDQLARPDPSVDVASAVRLLLDGMVGRGLGSEDATPAAADVPPVERPSDHGPAGRTTTHRAAG